MNQIYASINLTSSINKELDAILPMIQKAFNKAVKVVNSKLKNINNGYPINIVFIYDPENTIPEDGIVGRAINSGYILVSLNPKKVSENAIYTTICHELSHCKRFTEFPNIDNRLIAGLINEGLAVAFEEEIKDKKAKETFFLKTMNERIDTHKLLEHVRDDLFKLDFDWDKHYDELFFDGNKEKGIPRWAVYEIGYYLVKEKMKRTGKKASELFGVPSEQFIE